VIDVPVQLPDGSTTITTQTQTQSVMMIKGPPIEKLYQQAVTQLAQDNVALKARVTALEADKAAMLETQAAMLARLDALERATVRSEAVVWTEYK